MEEPRTVSSNPRTTSAKLTAHNDQASQAAPRLLIPPIPLPCSLAPSIITLLYSTTVSLALRQPLRSQAVVELWRTPYRRSSRNSSSRSGECYIRYSKYHKGGKGWRTEGCTLCSARGR